MATAKTRGVTVAHAAGILGVSVGTLRKWDKEGIFCARRAKNGYRMYAISALEAFAKKRGLMRQSSQKIKLIL